jgi:hypothetical protein
MMGRLRGGGRCLKVGRSEWLEDSEMVGVLDAIVDDNDRRLVYVRSKY